MNDYKNEIEIIIGGQIYKLCEYMYGALAYDHESPLCCVSEANNSFSIDYWKGCSFQCAYCHVQGIYEDLDDNFCMFKKPIPRSKFSINEIIDALVLHPFFIKDESVISIATSSTEPFASKTVTESTLRIMEYFVTLGYKNPFWIVTKAGLPNDISNRLKKICDNGNKIMISFCYAGNPKDIEPAQNDRFRNIELLKDTGVTTSWYMRPLVKEWGATSKKLDSMIKTISKKYGQYIDMIVPGGLRWTEGIEFGLSVQKKKKMPELIRNYDKKTLSVDIEQSIIDLCKKYFPGKPVYFNSSCAISHMLNKNNIALLNILNKDICSKSICYNKCKNKCLIHELNQEFIQLIQNEFDNQNIDVKLLAVNFEQGIITVPTFNKLDYTIRQQIKKIIANMISKR